jgi:hypothetical protein
MALPTEISRIVPDAPGAVVTALIMRLGLERERPAPPRVDGGGTHFDLPGGLLGSRAELVVTAEPTGTRVTLRGAPPPWPFSIGWAERTLRRYVP